MKSITKYEFPIEDFIDLCQLTEIKPNMNDPFPGRDHFLTWVNKKPERVNKALKAIKWGELDKELKTLILQWHKELPTLTELLG